MRLVIDGYNLLYAGGRTRAGADPEDLKRRRDDLIEQLSAYRRVKNCAMTVVFDGWQAGWPTEQKESRKGIEIIFSRVGEKADEVMKRLIREKGPGTILITSDHDVAIYAERAGAAVIPSESFRVRLVESPRGAAGGSGDETDQRTGFKGKGPSRRLSKKKKRVDLALKKL
jgi:uncharacterized protein